MVFGNLGDDCATGVAFTRNPATGDDAALRRVPDQRARRGRRRRHPHAAADRRAREAAAGGATPSSCDVAKLLEEHFRDMQDLEFTIQNGKLFMLQTRNGKRTGKAMVKVAVDLVAEGKLTAERSGDADRPGQARRGAAPDDRSEGAADAHREGLARVARRRNRHRSCSPRRPPRNGPATRRDGAARPHRHVARGHPRHEGRGRHPHGARRHDERTRAVVARGMGKCCVTACSALRVDAREEDRSVRRWRQGAQAQGRRHAHARRLDRRGVPRHRRRSCRRSSAPSSPR